MRKMTRDVRNALAIGRHECPQCGQAPGFRCIRQGTFPTRIGRAHKRRLDRVGKDEK